MQSLGFRVQGLGKHVMERDILEKCSGKGLGRHVRPCPGSLCLGFRI